MFIIKEITDKLHSFTTPVILVVLGAVAVFFGLFFYELLLTEVPIVTVITIIIYAIYQAKKGA